jgi:hypothetical protein
MIKGQDSVLVRDPMVMTMKIIFATSLNEGIGSSPSSGIIGGGVGTWGRGER